jgi:S1-C subfamily serine protease
MAGEVIGINTAIFSRTGGSIGIGFAIPSNIVRAVVDAARNGLDYFERPFVGATFETVDATMAEALGMARPHGALVRSVAPDGPAAKAGLAPGDVVLAMNGAAIEHPDALGYRLATSPIGSQAQLTVYSQGRERTLDVELIRAPEGASTAEIIIDGRSPFAGAKVAELSPRLAQRLRIGTEARGVAVVEVLPNSPAAGFGLRPRDIVREVNGEEIDTAEKLREAAAAQARWWRFTIERDGRLLNQVLRY